MEAQIARPGMGPRSTTMINADTSTAQLKAELILLKRKNLRLEKKEKRLQVSYVSCFSLPKGKPTKVAKSLLGIGCKRTNVAFAVENARGIQCRRKVNKGEVKKLDA